MSIFKFLQKILLLNKMIQIKSELNFNYNRF